jgi:predicted nucleic acid-binding Zn ribbon protein
VIQKFSDEPLQSHPDCGGAVERLISASALQFKGSGWYITDYAKGSGKDKATAEKGEKGEKGEKAEKKDSGESKAKTDSSSSSTATSTPASSTSTSSSDKK